MERTASTPRYLPHGAFHAALHERVAKHFAGSGGVPTEVRAIRIKSAVLFAWLIASYLLLAFWAASWLTAIPLAIALGLAMAGIGFNIQHDANHAAYSHSGALNAAMSMSLDALGGSSYLWTWKHNVFHHSNPNVVGLDSDIDLQPMARMAPSQPHHPWHRFQHVYIWGLYAFLVAKWGLWDDARDLISGKIRGQVFPRPRGWKLFALVAWKLFFLAWTLVIPSFFHPFWQVAVFYALVTASASVTMALTFQSAHATDGVTFLGAANAKAGTEWAEHQVRTTVNFAPENRLLTWYLGGLNFQIEHHLFPRISHLHLPALSRIVQQTCQDFGVPYVVHRTARSAIATHARWLRKLAAGGPDTTAQALASAA